MKNTLTLFIFFVFVGTVNAQWNSDTLLRTRVCRYILAGQFDPVICKGDSSTNLIFWKDNRNNFSIYGQRVDSGGYLMWDSLGKSVRVNLSGNAPDDLAAFPDGNGGAFVIYIDLVSNSTEVRAQRVDRDGNILWGTNGILVRGNIVFETFSHLRGTLANNGDLMITWTRDASTNSIEAQKIDTSANLLWGTNGVVVSTSYVAPEIVSDNNDGAFICWSVNTDSTYVQHLDNNGTNLFSNPIGLGIYPVNSNGQEMIADGMGGVYVAGKYYYMGAYHIYVFHIDSNGGNTFSSSGLSFTNVINIGNDVRSVSDGVGGVIVCWLEKLSGSSWGLRGLRIDSSGNNLWGNVPVIICTDTILYKGNLMIASDSSEGAYVVWVDNRYGYFTYYGQHLDGNSNLLWRANGYPICAAHMFTTSYSDVTFNLIGKPNSPLVTWTDLRVNGGFGRVYATDVFDAVTTNVNDISIGKSSPTIYPNPCTGNFIVSYPSSINNGTVNVFNAVGVNVFQENIFNESKKKINLGNVSQGIYFVKVFDGEKYYCKKLIVEHD